MTPKVLEVSQTLGIDAKQIYPVRNYNIQTECAREMDILNLRAQRQILRNSNDFLRDKFAMEPVEEMAKMKMRGEKKKCHRDESTSEDERYPTKKQPLPTGRLLEPT